METQDKQRDIINPWNISKVARVKSVTPESLEGCCGHHSGAPFSELWDIIKDKLTSIKLEKQMSLFSKMRKTVADQLDVSTGQNAILDYQ